LAKGVKAARQFGLIRRIDSRIERKDVYMNQSFFHRLCGCFQQNAFALLISLIWAGSAQAQFAGNSKAPVEMTADEIQSQGRVTSLSGQVDVRQGDVRVLADRMQIFSSQQVRGGDADDIERVIARGNFYYLTPKQEVRGDQGVYESVADTFTVTGNVILLQGEDNIVTGERLIYDVSSESARIVGTCQGRKCGSRGRVKALLKNRGSQSGAPSSGRPSL